MLRHYRYNTAMPVKRVPPAEAAELLRNGYTYVDVRTVPEFQAGHPPGALNIPTAIVAPGRPPTPNPGFEAAVARRFGKDDKIVLGCGSGGRSLRAAELLVAAGYTGVIDMLGGWNGDRTTRGWRDAGLGVESDAPGRTWEDLK